MTAPNANGVTVLATGPDDPAAALAAWFTPLRRSSTAWETGDGTPFTLITLLPGTEDPEVGFSDSILQVDTLADKALGYVNARNEANDTHQRALLLGRYPQGITLSGRVFDVDYLKVLERPHPEDFGVTTILRYVSRYQLGHPYAPVPT